VEVTETVTPSKVDFHLIRDDMSDDNDDSEAGRKKQGEPADDTSKSPTKATGDNAMDEAVKARNLEKELRKLDTSWNPRENQSMDKATVIETNADGQETAKEVHFVFNTELISKEDGDPKYFWSAVEGPQKELLYKASGMEAMNFIKRGS
jgi:hypothetical protein